MNDVERNGHLRVNQLKSNDHLRREKKLFPITMNMHLYFLTLIATSLLLVVICHFNDLHSDIREFR